MVSRFLERLRAGQPPIIHGDGEQTRDFVFVQDVVNAFVLAGGGLGIGGEAFNIGSGAAATINELAETLAGFAVRDRVLRPIHHPERAGDVRHSRADITKARQVLGYAPAMGLTDGLAHTHTWWCESGQSQ